MKGGFARAGKVSIYLGKFLFLILIPDKSFHRTNGGKSLLYHSVQTIHNALKSGVHRCHLRHDPEKNASQNRQAHKKYNRQLRIHPKGKQNSHYQKGRAPCHRTKSCIYHILKHRYIRSHSCDQRGHCEMIQVGKCILLHLLILRFPDLRAPAISRLRCKMCIQKPGNQRHQRTQDHLNSFLINIRKIMVCHSHIDQIRDHNRNKQFKAGLDQNQHCPQHHIPPIRPRILQKPLHIIHPGTTLLMSYLSSDIFNSLYTIFPFFL